MTTNAWGTETPHHVVAYCHDARRSLVDALKQIQRDCEEALKKVNVYGAGDYRHILHLQAVEEIVYYGALYNERIRNLDVTEEYRYALAQGRVGGKYKSSLALDEIAEPDEEQRAVVEKYLAKEES